MERFYRQKEDSEAMGKRKWLFLDRDTSEEGKDVWLHRSTHGLLKKSSDRLV